jgi:UDP-N-acetylmuramate dehydrogenase
VSGPLDPTHPAPTAPTAATVQALPTAPTAQTPFDPVAIGTAIQRRIGVKTSRDEPLGRFTTMRVGGPADLFATVHNIHELRAIVRFARSRGIPITLLGRGSDVVIADAGIRGLVVQNRAEGSRVEGDRYVAESGLPMARAATEAQAAGLTGLEFGLAIPGTVGGAVWANAGAHDADVAGILESADVLLADGSEARLTVDELDFRYRDSRLKHRSDEVVLAATFRLGQADPAAIAARLDDIKRWRREHQPLGIPSAGSTFRNPPDDSAGRLIDALGWKGRTRGGATVSEKHANFIVNDRKGTAADVRGLIDEVAAAVEHETGIRLEEEVVFLGDWSDRP